MDWLLVYLHSDGRASVLTWLAGEDSPDMGPAFDLVWPLDENATADLRWYLEDYLTAPFGGYEDRGLQVQARLSEWGALVFQTVFGSGPARDAYWRLHTRRAGKKLVFRSSSPALLGLPWELIHDPNRPFPLALDLAGMSRSLPSTVLAEAIPVPGGRLRVLMVISRPMSSGADYQLIARPLLQRLEAVRGEVELVVLRPPTLAALVETLAEATARGEPFQVVHFDGHGIPGVRQSPADAHPRVITEGALVFENEVGGPDEVPASRIAQVMKEAAVPVVVLNVGRSGAIGKDLETAVATRLLQEGAASVVAMAYAVYSAAAAEFMAAFYDRLFAGDPISSAVSAGRRRIYIRNARPSPKGEMRLDDWLVPVHYVRRDVSFPLTRKLRAGELILEEQLDQIRSAAERTATDELDAVGSFIGRDAMIYELEVATRLRRVVVLHGPGGTGKTELAKAFGRWWRDTGGVEDPGLVFMHPFEPEVAALGLDEVIRRIGLRLFGSNFAQLEPEQRRAAVQQVLCERRALLIWDSFEVVRSMPDAAAVTRPLDRKGCAEIGNFLAHLEQGSCSTVVITSRTSEDWLGDVRRIAVGGLTSGEGGELASYLLEPYPAAAERRVRRSFGELMEWLDGHPLSMRLVLPQLETSQPIELLEALRGTVPLSGVMKRRGGRVTSLSASIEYSYAHLTASTRRLLSVVSLLQEIAHEDLLAVFSQVPGVPGNFNGTTKEEWRTSLNETARIGLLTPLGSGMYQIHPALPAYLAAQWRDGEPGQYDVMREAVTRALAIACGSFSDWLYQQVDSGDAKLAYSIICLQRRTLGSMLDYALTHGLWQIAQAIVQPLDSYWNVRGLGEEAAAWADRVRDATAGADRGPAPADSPAGALWLFVTSSEAARLAGRLRLDEAEGTYRTILTWTQALAPGPAQQKNLAVTYHQLGTIAAERGRLDEAEDWYRKSLAIDIELADKAGIASTYHQLGVVAQYRGRPDEAEDWYRKSLAIKEEYGGRPSIAISYHQLGMVAQHRGRLDEAEDWYRKSLAIDIELADKAGIASTYHQLGVVAQYRGRLDEAEEWYRESLAIKEQLDDTAGMAFSFGQLGLLAEDRGEIVQALEWLVRCVTLFNEFPHPCSEPGPTHLARLATMLGVSSLEESWRKVTGDPLPQAVRDYLEPGSPGCP